MENKVYKVVRKQNGELVSVWAGTQSYKVYKPVTYKEGQISYAPEGQGGLAVFGDLKDAKTFLIHSVHSNLGQNIGEIHEATALGTKGYPISGGWGDSNCTYPAILLGKKVYPEATRPAPKFNVGDKVCFGTLKDVLTIKDSEWLGDQYAYHFTENSRFNSECYLHLAPKEEWVDVTQECTVLYLCGTGGNYIHLRHEGKILAAFGLGGHYKNTTGDNYKIELGKKNYLGTLGTFKVLKKVVK